MKSHLKLCALALSFLGLTACSSIANQTPDQMYRTSMQRQFKQDSQYNFTGKLFVQTSPNANAKTREQALNTLIERETAIAKWKYQDNPKMRSKTQIRQRAEKKLASSELLAEHFAKNISVPVSGAWDLPNGKLEIVPEIRYETRASGAYFKLPIQIDAKQSSALIDLAGASAFADAYTVRNDLAVEPINNRYVRITLPESLRKNIPLKDLFKSLPKAFDDGIAQMDKTQFAMLPLDERAKRLGATYRISHKQNSEQGEIYSTALFNSIVQQLEENQKNGTAQSDVSPENHAKFIEMLKTIKQSMEEARKNVKAVGENGESEIANMESLLNKIEVETELYLDGKGRILALVQAADMPDELFDKLFYGKHVRLIYETEMQYSSKPVFVIQANESNTVDLEKISPKFKELMDKTIQAE